MTPPAGAVVWVTGLPSSGKTTLANRLRDRLRGEAIPCVLLDGDAVRAALVPSPGYAPAERDAFYATLAKLAAYIARQGLVVVVAATAHRRAHRAEARRAAPRFVEVHLNVSAEECARRDAKGLFARARAGDAPHLPGGPGVDYEPPEAPDVVASGGEDQAAIDAIVRLLGAQVK